MPKTLADITAAVQANPALRKQIGRDRMWQACGECTLAACNNAAAGCRARQVLSALRAAQYRRNRERNCARQRTWYQQNREASLAQHLAYAKDPIVRAVRNAKRAAAMTPEKLARRRARAKAKWRTMNEAQRAACRAEWRERYHRHKAKADHPPTGETPHA